jgi:lysophospholipase L1-like esterase
MRTVRKIALKEIAKGLAATVVALMILELLLRLVYFTRNSMADYVLLPYAIGDEYGPIPPWLDGLRILERDDALIWKNRSNLQRRYIDIFRPVYTEQERTFLLRQFFPRLPESLKGTQVWEILLNSDGFRNEDFPKSKRPSVFRIVCLGDSWTFGWNVGQHQAYPQQLSTLLRREFLGANFEVFNLGVGGYSSYQGLELLKRKAIDLDPDLVVIGFAMNDARVAGFRDLDMSSYKEPSTQRIARVLEKIETYKLLRYLALVLKYKPKLIAEQLKADADSAQKGEDIFEKKRFVPQDYEKVESWTRVSLNDYQKNILEMINLAKGRRAGVVLLYNGLWRESPYRSTLEKISKVEKVPLVDSSAMIAEAQRRIEEELEKKLDLRPPREHQISDNGEIEVVFRVYLRDPVPKAVSIVGNHPKLGNLVPNKVTMYDDGTHGDQRARDNVWSYSARFPPGTKLFYVYTNSGEEGKWEGLDIPGIRAFKVEGKNNEKKLYRPIESFGRLYMQSDNWHTNADGYEMIAKALLEVLRREQKVKDYLRELNGSLRQSPLPGPFLPDLAGKEGK